MTQIGNDQTVGNDNHHTDISECMSGNDSECDVSFCDTDGISNADDIISLLKPMEDEHIDDLLMVSNDPDIPDEEMLTEDFPTTVSGDVEYKVIEDIPKGHYVSGHVIMNQCGSLLNRNDKEITGYRSQKSFLQRIASISHGESIPLLYPEAMMFPSIFWKMIKRCGR